MVMARCKTGFRLPGGKNALHPSPTVSFVFHCIQCMAPISIPTVLGLAFHARVRVRCASLLMTWWASFGRGSSALNGGAYVTSVQDWAHGVQDSAFLDTQTGARDKPRSISFPALFIATLIHLLALCKSAMRLVPQRC